MSTSAQGSKGCVVGRANIEAGIRRSSKLSGGYDFLSAGSSRFQLSSLPNAMLGPHYKETWNVESLGHLGAPMIQPTKTKLGIGSPKRAKI